ncbi:site-specific integrase [Peribacillus simplex]|uniref:site-specific integrase n=1 Tax=Peribacillus simplex TaxID=1478 RepID=UPI00338E660C
MKEKRLVPSNIRCSPHTLRHIFATLFIRNGGSVFELQKILGHANLTMTQRYCFIDEESLLESSDKFNPLNNLG